MIEGFLFPAAAPAGAAPETDVVLSSHGRLSRNVDEASFAWKAQAAERQATRSALVAAWLRFEGRNSLDLRSLKADERRALAEREAIGQDYALDAEAWLGWDAGEALWATANEGDHVRLRAEAPGLAPRAIAASLSRVELELGASLSWAFDPRIGYLAPDPADCGSGLALSAILHLPALSMTLRLEPVFRELLAAGLELSGYWSEEGASSASIYELGLRCPADQAPADAADRLEAAALRLAEREREARDSLSERDPLGLADALGRAFGLARHARTLRYDEAAEAVSLLRLGIERGLVSGVRLEQASALLVGLRRSHLALSATRQGSPEGERRSDVLRAAFAGAVLVQEHARV